MVWHCSGGTGVAASLSLLIFLVIVVFHTQPVSAGGGLHNSDNTIKSSCEQKECQRCDLATGRCLKCRYAMLESTRACIPYCPVGHAATVRQDQLYQGTVCTPGSLLAAVTGRDIAVIACAAAGGAVCVGIILGAIIYARRNAMLKPMPDDGPVKKIPVPRMWRDHRPSAADTTVSAEERKEFLQTLAMLRKDVGLLLEMLSETRSRFRGIGGPEHTMDSKARAYRAVVRDLTRVVSLVARRDDSFHCVPADWRRLLAWADRLLTRYRRTRDSKCSGCTQHHQVVEHRQDEANFVQNGTNSGQQSTPGSSQPLFQTRQQAKEERWRKQREEAAKTLEDLQRKISYTDTDSSNESVYKSSSESSKSELHSSSSCFSISPAILEEVINEEEQDTLHLQFCKVDPHDIEISYSKDEEALAYQKAQCTLADENFKNELKTSNVNFDTGSSNTKSNKDKGSPSMISRIFCKRLNSNNELNMNENLDDLHKKQKTNDINILQDEECLSSSSIYDHIEAFTFDDFSTPTKSEVKQTSSKPKTKNTANVNINRLRKPNFPGYSESFKQILDKRNLLTIQKTKIQKRLSRKGEQLNKMVRRSESRFLKDKSKLDPNMTYDRRNCKNDVVNKEMIGGDVYVSVVKQPVVEREKGEHSGSYKNFNELEGETEDEESKQEPMDDKHNATVIQIDGNPADKSIRCELLTVV